MTEKKEKHICKFRRLRYKSGNEIFFCSLPDCNKKMNPALLLGKRSICWRCGEPFIMNDYSLRLAKPHCESCHKSKNQEEIPQPPSEFPSNREIREGDISGSLSLFDRLKQKISKPKQEQEEEEL